MPSSVRWQLFHNSFFMQMFFCLPSKEESGFLAVPLLDKGVVVVAVGYDIAPKGRVLSST